jgi:hypothetical protein
MQADALDKVLRTWQAAGQGAQTGRLPDTC